MVAFSRPGAFVDEDVDDDDLWWQMMLEDEGLEHLVDPFAEEPHQQDPESKESDTRRPPKVRKKEVGKREGQFDDDFPPGDPRRFLFPSEKSPWWSLVRHKDVRVPGSKKALRFRKRLRVPFPLFERILHRAQEVPRWMDKPAGPGHGRGPPRKPLTLLVLAALRHMGAGVDYDDLEEVS